MYDTYEILASGMSAARLRLNVLSSNIANAETSHTTEGGPYKRRDVVQVATTLPHEGTFQSGLDRMTLMKPSVLAVVEDQSEPRLVFQPGHPDADGDGMVPYPNINVVTSMTDLIAVSRLYQANVTALETAREMSDQAQAISLRG
jgi:flagellar basal-body rod protein FlgC